MDGARDPGEHIALADAAVAFLLFFVPPALVATLLPQSKPGVENLAANVETGSLILLAGMVPLIAFAVWRRGALPPLRWRPGFTLGLYFAFLVAWIPLAMIVYPYLVNLAGFEFQAQRPVRYYAQTDHGAGFWLVLLVSCVGAPLAEELFFRGFLFRAVESVGPPVVAWLATSVLFGAVHEPSVMIPVGILGLCFGWLRWKTGSVAASILAHFVHNAWTVGLLMLRPEWLDLVYDK